VDLEADWCLGLEHLVRIAGISKRCRELWLVLESPLQVVLGGAGDGTWVDLTRWLLGPAKEMVAFYRPPPGTVGGLQAERHLSDGVCPRGAPVAVEWHFEAKVDVEAGTILGVPQPEGEAEQEQPLDPMDRDFPPGEGWRRLNIRSFFRPPPDRRPPPGWKSLGDLADEVLRGVATAGGRPEPGRDYLRGKMLALLGLDARVSDDAILLSVRAMRAAASEQHRWLCTALFGGTVNPATQQRWTWRDVQVRLLMRGTPLAPRPTPPPAEDRQTLWYDLPMGVERVEDPWRGVILAAGATGPWRLVRADLPYVPGTKVAVCRVDPTGALYVRAVPKEGPLPAVPPAEAPAAPPLPPLGPWEPEGHPVQHATLWYRVAPEGVPTVNDVPHAAEVYAADGAWWATLRGPASKGECPIRLGPDSRNAVIALADARLPGMWPGHALAGGALTEGDEAPADKKDPDPS
jgi:hypothetical protein